MLCRYIFGYILCITTFLLMSTVVTYFLWFYTTDECWQWFITVIMICVSDMLLFAFGIAAF